MKVQKLNKRRYLGSLCNKEHRYVYESTDSSAKRTTNQSVRYKSCKACCVCSAISVELRKKQQKKYRDTHKKKMKKYHDNYRKSHKNNYRAGYQHNYYLTVTKPKREKLFKNFDRFMKEIHKGLEAARNIPIELLEK